MADDLSTRNRWTERDRPVLVEIARLVDDGADHLTDEDVDIEGLDDTAVLAACRELDGVYLEGKAGGASMGGGPTFYLVTGLTERGRREAGLWPNEDAMADSLAGLLHEAAEQVDDADERTALRKAAGLLATVPSQVVSGVTLAWIKQQTGAL